uniref:Uncharacterized protein n=1 Tax=Sphaeramia orbicularis TaxID=375764 RepID=A0A672ZRC3_9TELE
KKAKLRKSCLQIMDDEEEDQLDNTCRSAFVWSRENDNLAYRLITGKIALRNALDTVQPADVGDTLKCQIQNGFPKVIKKKMFELDGVCSSFAQICSQLTKRLEEQRAAHREELDSHQVRKMKACRRCRHHGSAEGFTTEEQNQDKDNKDRRKESLRAQIRDLEQELAQTKLQVVEAKCKIQELEHQKGTLTNNLQESKNSWLSKAFTSLRTSSGRLNSISNQRTPHPPKPGTCLGKETLKNSYGVQEHRM